MVVTLGIWYTLQRCRAVGLVDGLVLGLIVCCYPLHQGMYEVPLHDGLVAARRAVEEVGQPPAAPADA